LSGNGQVSIGRLARDLKFLTAKLRTYMPMAHFLREIPVNSIILGFLAGCMFACGMYHSAHKF